MNNEEEISEVKAANKKLTENIRNSRSFAQSSRNKTPEERQTLENARRQQMAQMENRLKGIQTDNLDRQKY